MKKLLKVIALCSLALLVTTACSSDKFTINGTVEGVESNQKAFLSIFTEKGPEIVDTAIVEKGGKFTFTGKMDKNDFRQISFENQPGELMIYIDNSKITLTSNYNDLSNVTVKGSKAFDYFKSLDDMEKSNNDYVQTKVSAYQNAQQTNDTIAMGKLNDEVLNYQKDYIKKVFAMINEHPNDMLSMFLLNKYVDVIDINELSAFYAKVPQSIKDDFRLKPFIDNKLSKMLTLSNGNPVPEFVVHNIATSDTISSSTIKGKDNALYITDVTATTDNDIVFPILKAAKAKNPELNVMVLIYSSITPEKLKEYQELTGTQEFVYVSAIDPVFFEKFFAVTPRTIWISKDGKIQGMSVKAEDTQKVYDAIK